MYWQSDTINGLMRHAFWHLVIIMVLGAALQATNAQVPGGQASCRPKGPDGSLNTSSVLRTPQFLPQPLIPEQYPNTSSLCDNAVISVLYGNRCLVDSTADCCTSECSQALEVEVLRIPRCIEAYTSQVCSQSGVNYSETTLSFLSYCGYQITCTDAQRGLQGLQPPFGGGLGTVAPDTPIQTPAANTSLIDNAAAGGDQPDRPSAQVFGPPIGIGKL